MKEKLFAAVTAISVLAQPILAGIPYAPVKSVSAQAAPASVVGDVNADGNISSADLVMLQNHILRRNEISADVWQNSDLDGDGIIDSFDVVLLRQMILNSGGLEKYAGLMINEVCSSAKESVKDAAGESPDWVEIYNSSDEALDISGIGLSDGAKKKFKFAFPEGTVIPADGYILVYCDDAVNEAEGEYHAAFKLSADGETVYMTHPDYGEIDSVEVPLLGEDVTWGRYANGSDNFTYLSYTPGKTNDTAEDLTPVEMPVFSAEGGFYDEAFGLTLSDSFGSEIIYTTDGSDPRTSETAKLYAGEIKIYDNTSDPNVYSAITDINLSGYKAPKTSVDKGIIVRAVCRTADGKYSNVATNSYFVGKTADYYSDFKVISISTDSDYLFDKDNGFYMVGKNYHDLVSKGEFILKDANDASNPTNYNIDGKDSEFPANVQVFEDGKLVYTNDVGARLSGNWSRGYAQKSIRLYARSEYGDSKLEYEFIEGLTDINGDPIEEFDKVTLRNGGTDNQLLHFRDLLIQTLCADRAMAVQGGEPCMVFLEGEFWGFYFIREKQDADFVEAHYGIDKDNVTFIKNSELDDGSKDLDREYKEFLKWAGSADMTDPANYEKVCNSVDIQSFIDMIVIETYINNVDWATEYMNNWITWRATEPDESLAYADGKWRYMLYDLDFSADYFDDARSLVGFDSLNNLYMGNDPYNFVPMFYNLLKNKDFADQFYNSYIDVMKNNFDPVKVSEKLDEFVEKYKEAITITNTRFDQEWVNLNYDAEIEAFRQFFIGRRNLAKMYLDKLYGIETNMTAGSDVLSDESGWSYYGDATVSKSDGVFTLTANKKCPNSWDIQSQSKSLTIEKGKTYKVTFEAKCSTSSPIAVTINHQVGNSWPSCFSKSGINLTNDFKEYSFTFVSAHNTASDWKFCVDFGNGAGVYTIRNASFTEISYDTELVNAVGEWEFYDPAGNGKLTVNAHNNITVETFDLPDERWEVQPFYNGMVLDAGKTYTLSFTINGNIKTDIDVNIQENFGDYKKIAGEKISVGTSAETHTITFKADEQCMDTSICFNCGGAVGTIEISDISMICTN
ncbi:MAG: CotH kinase family protein [Ruminococcus sp.]|nr:CotH kinase family protein [Ruminococcus sp.]